MASNLPTLDELLASWLTVLRSEKKSPSTLKVYRSGVIAFLEFCAAQGIPAELTKPNVIAFMATLADHEPATSRVRLTALKLFARWLAAEEGFDADPILTIRAPKMDQRVIPHLSDTAVRAMVAVCGGAELRDKRDKALIVMFTETGVRASEMLSLEIGDVSIGECVCTVRRGKGGKGRRVKFSPQCAALLDRYIRARRRAGFDVAALWVGPRGPLSYTGMTSALRTRAEAAGIPGFHVHRLRHTSAVRWLKSGGSETGLMAQAGWASRTMIDRYIKSASEELAADEFDRLGLGLDDV